MRTDYSGSANRNHLFRQCTRRPCSPVPNPHPKSLGAANPLVPCTSLGAITRCHAPRCNYPMSISVNIRRRCGHACAASCCACRRRENCRGGWNPGGSSGDETALKVRTNCFSQRRYGRPAIRKDVPGLNSKQESNQHLGAMNQRLGAHPGAMHLCSAPLLISSRNSLRKPHTQRDL